MANEKKIRVLIVDDSRVVRVAASRMFGDEFDVLLAVDGADGLRVVENDPTINIIFTDLAMPEMDGFELLKAIRQHTREDIRAIPVVVATGAGNASAAKQKAFAIGATDFISKPFNGIDLQARAKAYAKFQQENKQLKDQVTTDALTGLINRKGFQKQLSKEVSFVKRHDGNMTLMKVEIDNYKDLFVRIGRDGTEKLIVRVASIFENTFRREDTIARAGLARFVVSLPVSEAADVMQLANRICHTVESFKASLDKRPIKITVSIGVCSVSPNNIGDGSTLMEMADLALSRAQESGASQVYQLAHDEYLAYKEDALKKQLSIDEVLKKIQDGKELEVATQLEAVVDRLSPIFALMSNEHFQQLYDLRSPKSSNNVFSISNYHTKQPRP